MTNFEFIKNNPVAALVAAVIFFIFLFFPFVVVSLLVIVWIYETFIKKSSTQPTSIKSTRTTPSNYFSPNLDRWTTEQYHTYLQSSEWKSLVSKVKSRDQVCQLTRSSDNLEVHHITYDRLGSEDLSDLVLLSRSAHQFVHDYYGSYSRNNTYPINNLKGMI